MHSVSTMELHQRTPTKCATHFDLANPKSQKSWNLACKSVQFIIKLSKKVVALKNKKLTTSRVVVRSPSYIVVDVDSDSVTSTHDNVQKTPGSCPFAVDQRSLTSMTREKDLQYLSQLGSVKNLAFTLATKKEQLGVSSIDTNDLLQRKTVFGSNLFKKPPQKSFLSFVIEALKDTTIIILFLCACLSLGFGIKQHGPKEGWYDGGSIFFPIILVVSVSAISNFKLSQQLEKLSSNDTRVEALRDGRHQHISSFDVLVGDIVFLKIGDQIPADGLFLDGHSLKVDISSMTTGESDQLSIADEYNPFLFSGTKVIDGYGRMLVTSVGMNTEWGETMSSINRYLAQGTPLQNRLKKLTLFMGQVGLLVASLAVLVQLIHYLIKHTKDQAISGRRKKSDDIMNIVISIFSTGNPIVVAAIPVGLPLAVMLTITHSMKKMRTNNVLVRKISDHDTMGLITTLCTDKNGTLTLNKMSVIVFWHGKEIIQNPLSLSKDVQELLQVAIGLNTSGCVTKIHSNSTPEISGTPIEKAFLKWAIDDLGLEIRHLNTMFKILKVEAFNSKRKRSGVMVRKASDKRVQVHWKGAAETILSMCSSYYNQRGMLVRMEEGDKKDFTEIIQKMASQSLRCIAFAYKEYNNVDATQHLVESGFTLLGFAGLKDPCRPGVQEAIVSCKEAGVSVKMITGDNIFTARSIAVECGILQPHDHLRGEAVIEGIEFRNYTHEERMCKIDSIRVMARSSPFDKLLMVQCLKEKGHVVAMTGDGTNDALALKEADIGLSMGIQGTEVARQSSDIVILDDNFASVVTVLSWGRCVYNNIQRFIQFQLTANVAAVTINFVTAVSSGIASLTIVQLLWVNLIKVILEAFASVTEKPSDDLIKKTPVGRTKPLITKVMWRMIIVQAFYQVAVVLTLQYKGQNYGVGEGVKSTFIFNCFVFCQVFNEINARMLEKNKLFLGIVGIIVALQVVMVEFLNKYAGTEKLNWGQWSACIAIAAVSWPLG